MRQQQGGFNRKQDEEEGDELDDLEEDQGEEEDEDGIENLDEDEGDVEDDEF